MVHTQRQRKERTNSKDSERATEVSVDPDEERDQYRHHQHADNRSADDVGENQVRVQLIGALSGLLVGLLLVLSEQSSNAQRLQQTDDPTDHPEASEAREQRLFEVIFDGRFLHDDGVRRR